MYIFCNFASWSLQPWCQIVDYIHPAIRARLNVFLTSSHYRLLGGGWVAGMTFPSNFLRLLVTLWIHVCNIWVGTDSDVLIRRYLLIQWKLLAMASIHSNSWIFVFHSSLLLCVSQLIWGHLFLILQFLGLESLRFSCEPCPLFRLRQVRLDFPKDLGKPPKTVPAHYDHTSGVRVPQTWKIVSGQGLGWAKKWSSDQDVVFSMPPLDVPQKVQKVRMGSWVWWVWWVGWFKSSVFLGNLNWTDHYIVELWMFKPLGEVPFGRAYFSPCLYPMAPCWDGIWRKT